MVSNDATNRLTALATKGEWNRFFQIYQENNQTHNAAITDSGETQLHVVLSRKAPEDVVEKMLDLIVSKGVPEAYKCLKMADLEGKTAASHLAASKGYARVCGRIAELIKNAESQHLVRLDDMTNVENIFHAAVSKELTDAVINLSKLFPKLAEELTDADKDIIRRTLFKLVMKGEWERVIGIYSGIPAVHKFKITKSDDTALHIAVNEGPETVVQELVDLIKSKGTDRAKEALKVGNERGNTPLHLAAALGNVQMRKSIANVDSSLVSERNGDNETPVFLAALHGEKDVFLSLHDMWKTWSNSRLFVLAEG